MKEKSHRNFSKLALALILLLISGIMVSGLETQQIQITQQIQVSRSVYDEDNNVNFNVSKLPRVGPGGYAEIEWSITNEDPDLSLKGYYVCFLIDPEIVMGSINWEKVEEEANGPSGYRWTFGDNLRYAINNTYLMQKMGNGAKTVYNVFATKDAQKVDINVTLALTEQTPDNPSFFDKFVEEDIFGVTLRIPDLEPTTRIGRHSWSISEGIEDKGLLGSKKVYPKAYVVISKGAILGEEHKLVALVCQADPSSIFQWSSFNVISYEEITFKVEKPQVSQSLALVGFIAFGVISWYTKWWKKLKIKL